jgi:glycosyltransferase involved in cell wall biosynthesis
MGNKISLITAYWNQLPLLRETLPRNIRDNEGYQDLDFVVMDHGSADGLEDWIAADMGDQISTGRLKYYRTLEKGRYNRSQLKNAAFSVANGNVLCNLEPDYLTGPAFAAYVDEVFSKNRGIVITPIDFHGIRKGYHVPADLFGFCCVKKVDFHKVGGFDESMNNYGFEVLDLINRLELAGVTRYFPEDISRFTCMAHDREQRHGLAEVLATICRVLVAYIDPARSRWVIEYTDGSYERFCLVDKYALESPFFVSAYTTNQNRYQLYLEDIQYGHGSWTGGDLEYMEVSNKLTISKLLDFKFTFHSRFIMEQNIKHRRIVPDRHCCAKAEIDQMVHKL